MARNAVAKMPLVFGPLSLFRSSPDQVCSVEIKLYSLQNRRPFAETLVHGKCGSKIVHKDLCPHCELPLSGVAKGSSQARPRKQTACNHATCNKSLADQTITSFAYCEQEGCTCKLKDDDIQLRVSSGYDEEQRLFVLSDDERCNLEALRLTYERDKPPAFKCMVVQGVIRQNDKVPFERVTNARQVCGDGAIAQQFIFDLIAHMHASGERLLVHYAIQHEQKLTGQYEHAALLAASSDGKALVLYDLLGSKEMHALNLRPDDHKSSDDAVNALRQTFAALPVVNPNSVALQGTNLVTSLEQLTEAKIAGEDFEPPNFVDADGSIRSAAGRHLFGLLKKGAVFVPMTASSSSEESST